MASKNKNIVLGYKIIKIQTIKFSFEEVENQIFDSLLIQEDALSINLHTAFTIDKETSIITFDIHTQLVQKEISKTLIEHIGRTEYKIEGLDKAYNKEKDLFDLPDNFVIQLYSIGYTHARALLSVEVSPTMYKEKYFLPVIDPSNLLK